MKILVTGSNGFLGKNLVSSLKNIKDGRDQTHKDIIIDEIYEFDINTEHDKLYEYCRDVDFVFHFAGVNRPLNDEEFFEGNLGFTEELLKCLERNGNNCRVLLSSSTQAELDNPYGKSKRAAEEAVREYAQNSGFEPLIYRFPNLFGKWCRPNYNSVVATFCHNIANDLPIKINAPDAIIKLAYIDDVISEMLNVLVCKENRNGEFCELPVTHSVTLQNIADSIYSFKESRNSLDIPDMSNAFTKKLYATYLSYLPENSFSYPLKMNCDNRGSFTEIIRTNDRGQFSVNIIKPHITKGNHWHHTKNEKFVVVSGNGVIRFRKHSCNKVIEYFVSGDKLEVVDIPCGYTHNIENLGDSDMVVFMWCCECFNPEIPDTFYCEV